MPTSSKSVSGGPFFIHIEGLPGNYTWKDLKDLIRARARHGVWTDMSGVKDNSRSGRGFARIQRESEARNLFDGLCNGSLISTRLMVHLWDISDSQPQFIKCNCAPHSGNDAFLNIAKYAGNPGYWRDLTPPQGSPNYPAQASVSYTTPYPTQAALNVQQQRSYPTVMAQQAYGQAQYQAPAFVSSSTGIPKDVSQGYAVVEHRGVHVKNLDYSLSRRDIMHCFSKAGHIEQCDLSTDRATGRFKGHATIRYATEKEATQATEIFNGRILNGRPIQVRLDRNGTPVRAPATSSSSQQRARSNATPVIVNGSSGLQAH